MKERGQIIKELRAKTGMSQEAVAWDSGIEQSHISCYENGIHKPSWERFCKILDVMGYEVVIREKNK